MHAIRADKNLLPKDNASSYGKWLKFVWMFHNIDMITHTTAFDKPVNRTGYTSW